MGNLNIVILNMVCAVFLAIVALLLFYFFIKEKNNRKKLVKEHDRLRVSEEQYRIASDAFHLNVARYDIEHGIYYNSSQILNDLGFSDKIENVPQVFIDAGVIAPECIDELRFFMNR